MRRFSAPVVVMLTNVYQHGRRVCRCVGSTDYDDGRIKFTIVDGSETDWVSTPWWLWWVFPSFDRAAEAALLHDSLLKLRLVLEQMVPVPVSRLSVDKLFRDAMEPLGVAHWRRNLMYAGVRFNAWQTGDR